MELFNHYDNIKLVEVCSICLNYDDDISGISLCKQCNKNFHKICLIKWFQKKENCPNCRFEKYIDFDLEMMEQIIIFNEMSDITNSFYGGIVLFYFMIFIIKCLFITIIIVLAIYFYIF